MNVRRSLSTALFFAISTLLMAISAWPQTADVQEEHFSRRFTVNPGSSLVVDNFKGTIHVTGSESKQVNVKVDKVFQGTESDRKWWMANTRVNFENDPSRVRVAVQYPNSSCFLGCGDGIQSDYMAAVELTIQVPKHTNVELSGHKPDVKVSAVDGDLQIHSYKSPINIESTTGSIDIKTYKETVNLRDVSIRGAFRLVMFKGDATLIAKTLGDDVSIETEKGSVVLQLPHTAGLTVHYSGGRRANFHSDLPITSTAGLRSNELSGTINGGGTHLRLRTEKGSFSLESTR